MSEENVEVVRRQLDAANAGDMDAVRELLDAEVILRPVEDWPERGPFVGREAVMPWYEQLREAFDMSAFEPISYADTAEHVPRRVPFPLARAMGRTGFEPGTDGL